MTRGVLFLDFLFLARKAYRGAIGDSQLQLSGRKSHGGLRYFLLYKNLGTLAVERSLLSLGWRRMRNWVECRMQLQN